jgi:hypothetical protein
MADARPGGIWDVEVDAKIKENKNSDKGFSDADADSMDIYCDGKSDHDDRFEAVKNQSLDAIKEREGASSILGRAKKQQG